MRIILATSNRAKASEISAMLAGASVELLTLNDFPNLKLPPETGSTFAENALIKARCVHSATNLPALADDSGLEVYYLNGRPGVYSARYAGEGATDEDNWRKLLKELSGAPEEKRGARFVCALAFVTSEGEEVYEGTLEGRIAATPKGANGFGYDPVFFLPGIDRTVAELRPGEKNEISHRAAALRKFRERLLRGRGARPRGQ